jgi:hypothetical protein
LDKKIGIPVPWAGISRGGSPLHGKLNFFRTQLPFSIRLTVTTEFANRGKLSGKVILAAGAKTAKMDLRQGLRVIRVELAGGRVCDLLAPVETLD